MSIDYTGGHGKYEPPLGGFLPGENVSTNVEDFSYADDKRLREMLALLIDEANSFQRILETGLTNYAMWVDRDDVALADANKAEWPEGLGDPSNKVSYRYYKALQTRNTASAAYIRRRFEDAARDVTGTNALDFLAIVRMTLDEAYRVQGFLNEYVGQVDDSSEHRSLELFQDWVEESTNYTRQFRSFYEEGKERQQQYLPRDEIASLDPSEAKQGQAVFKVRLNEANDRITQDIDFLYKNFAEYGSVFYKRFLGPAMTFRLSVSRNALPQARNNITQAISDAANDLNTNLRTVLADQLRRNLLFTNKVGTLFNHIAERDQYRGYIRELAAKGRPLKAEGPGVMVDDYVEHEFEIETFDEVLRTAVIVWDEKTQQWMHPDDYRAKYGVDPPESAWEWQGDEGEGIPPDFEATHGSLTGLDTDDHPQYLLRRGGHLTGDVTLDPTVRIDGIRPGSHIHSGEDGSSRIRGTDIEGGTLPPDAVDVGTKPAKPTDLRLLGTKQTIIPPGVTAFDAQIAWDGDESLTYEVQVSRL